MADPLISVIIPTCHRNDDLAGCLERLGPGRQKGMELRQEGKVHGAEEKLSGGSGELAVGSWQLAEVGSLLMPTYEVIVSDDGPESTAEDMIRNRFPWARWVKGPGRGPAANRNCGAAQARGEWLAFTDDDCLPDAGWLSGFAAAISTASESPSLVMEGRTIAEGPKLHPMADAPVNESGGFLWSCNFCLREDMSSSVGGFDERFPYAAMEDLDLRIRLEKQGVFPTFVPEALIVHPWKKQNLIRHWRRHLKSQMIFLRLHPAQAYRFALGFHLRTIARYYAKQFIAEIRQFGWLALRAQPMRWRQFLTYGWVYMRKPDPGTMPD